MDIAGDLGYVGDLFNQGLGLNMAGGATNPSPTANQQAFRGLASAVVNPFTNAQTNIGKTYQDITKPVGGVLQSGLTDASDLYNLKHNPIGNPQSQGQPSVPKLSDEHLGPPNANGVRPVNDQGMEYLRNAGNNFGIQDNTSMLSASPTTTLAGGNDTLKPQSSPLAGAALGAAKNAVGNAASTSAAAEGTGLGSSLESLLALL